MHNSSYGVYSVQGIKSPTYDRQECRALLALTHTSHSLPFKKVVKTDLLNPYLAVNHLMRPRYGSAS